MQGLPPGAGPFCGVKGAKTGHTYPCRPRNSRKIAVFHPEWAQTLLKREKIWYTETIDETRGWEREDAERRRFEEKGEGPAAERAGPPAGTRVQAPEGSGGGGPGPGGGSPCPQDPGLGPGGRGRRAGRGGLAGGRLHPAGQLARQLRPGGDPGRGRPRPCRTAGQPPAVPGPRTRGGLGPACLGPGPGGRRPPAGFRLEELGGPVGGGAVPPRPGRRPGPGRLL